MHPTLGDAISWGAVALCAIAQFPLLHSFFLGASRPRRDAPARFRATETLWAVVPAVVLALLLGGTWRVMHAPLVMEWQPGAAVGGAAR